MFAHLVRISLIAILALPAFANAEEEWKFTVAPYLWMSGQSGKVATLPPAKPIDLDISFSDVLSHMDMSLMGLFEARKGRVGVFTEVFYVGISDDKKTPGSAYSGVDYEQDLWGITLGALYTMSESENYQLDAVTGVRFWDLDNQLKLKAGKLPEKKISEHQKWHDYLLGLKGKMALNENWFMTGWGVAAVAGDSDSAWDIYGGIGYRYNTSLSFNAGYRYQEVDYKDDLFLYDVELSGPTLGLSYQF